MTGRGDDDVSTRVEISTFNGTYKQRQPGLYMQRIRIPCGRITADQWRLLADLTDTHCGSAPLHLTTRQDIELHDIPEAAIPTVRARLADGDLYTIGTGGDSIRNITVCPDCDLKPAGVDLAEGIANIYAYLVSLPIAGDLPRKFKISFSACTQACAQPYVNDLGFVLGSDGRFVVIGAGSLGPRPNLGIVLRQSLAPEQVAPYCAAVLELFVRHADRQNRRKARLRHIRERMGDTAFIEAVEQCFAHRSRKRSLPQFPIAHSRTTLPFVEPLCPPLGDLTADAARQLANEIDDQGLVCRIGLHQDILLRSARPSRLTRPLVDLTGRPTIVCCPGNQSCPHGLADTKALVRRILDSDIAPALAGRCIHIGGCPNRCTHAAVAKMGFIGRQRTVDGVRREAFQTFSDGGQGRTDALAQPGPVLDADQVLDRLRAWAQSPASDRPTPS